MLLRGDGIRLNTSNLSRLIVCHFFVSSVAVVLYISFNLVFAVAKGVDESGKLIAEPLPHIIQKFEIKGGRPTGSNSPKVPTVLKEVRPYM